MKLLKVVRRNILKSNDQSMSQEDIKLIKRYWAKDRLNDVEERRKIE